jgi:phosphoserine phosphatase
MKLAIYDFDGTYVNIQTVPVIFKVWDKMKLNKHLSKKYFRTIKWWYLMHKIKLGWSKEVFRKNAMALTLDLLNHLDSDKRQQFNNAFYQYCQPLISPDLKKQLLLDKQQGYVCVLLSGNFNELLLPFKQEGFDDVIGSETEKNGQRLNSQTIDIIINQKKIESVKKRFDGESITHTKAYADSGYDLQLLLYVDEPYAYKPDKQLQKDAEKYGIPSYNQDSPNV